MGYRGGAVGLRGGAVGSRVRGSAGDLGEVSFKAVDLGQLRYQLGAAWQQ